MPAVALKVDAALNQQLQTMAQQRHTTPAVILREAVEAYARNPPQSFTAAAGPLVGSLHGPPDLSHAPHQLDGFGQ